MPPTKAESLAISETIRKQLGGRPFEVMTGATMFTYHNRSVSFRIPRAGPNKVRALKITLDENDTYSVVMYAIRKLDVTTVYEQSGIYAEDLRRIFTEQTGLYTTL